MKTIFTLLSAFFFFACSAQENELTWSEEQATQEVYERAVAKAKAMQACCGDYLEDKLLCLEQLPENFVNNLLSTHPEGLTETVEEADGVLTTTYVYIIQGNLKMLEKKVYDWGGEFYYKNYMCPITREKFIEELSALKAN